VKRRPSGPRWRAILVAFALAPTLAALSEEAAPRPGRYKVGPLWLTPKIDLKGAGRDTNVYNSETDPIADAAAILSPSLEVAWPVGRRLRLTGLGFVNVNWYREQGSERSVDRGGSLRSEVDFGPATVFGSASRGTYKRRFTIDLDERVSYLESSASVGARFRLASRVTASAAVDAGRFDLQDPASAPAVARSLDRDTRTFRLEGRYALTPRTTLVGTGEWIRDYFDQAIGSASSDVDSGRYLGGFEFKSKSLAGRVLGGVRVFPMSPEAGAPAYTGPALVLGLGFPLGTRARLGLESEREVYYAARPTFEDGVPVRNSYVSWRSRAELPVELPGDLLLRGLLGYESADYVLPYSDPLRPVEDTSRRWTYGGALLRVFSERFRIGGGVTWEHRLDHSVTPPYHGARWGLQAEVAP
jgi:hypothetical protein